MARSSRLLMNNKANLQQMERMVVQPDKPNAQWKNLRQVGATGKKIGNKLSSLIPRRYTTTPKRRSGSLQPLQRNGPKETTLPQDEAASGSTGAATEQEYTWQSYQRPETTTTSSLVGFGSELQVELGEAAFEDATEEFYQPFPAEGEGSQFLPSDDSCEVSDAVYGEYHLTIAAGLVPNCPLLSPLRHETQDWSSNWSTIADVGDTVALERKTKHLAIQPESENDDEVVTATENKHVTIISTANTTWEIASQFSEPSYFTDTLRPKCKKSLPKVAKEYVRPNKFQSPLPSRPAGIRLKDYQRSSSIPSELQDHATLDPQNAPNSVRGRNAVSVGLEYKGQTLRGARPRNNADNKTPIERSGQGIVRELTPSMIPVRSNAPKQPRLEVTANKSPSNAGSKSALEKKPADPSAMSKIPHSILCTRHRSSIRGPASSNMQKPRQPRRSIPVTKPWA